MRLLILLEDEKYLSVVESIKLNSLVEHEVSNIDFNITNPILRAEAVLFLGGDQAYQEFKEQYTQLLADKLIFTTAAFADKSRFEVELYIANGVVVCKIPLVSNEISSVIIEVTNNIFEGSLKPLISSEEKYCADLNSLKQLDLALKKVSSDSLEVLPQQIIQQVIDTFTIKNT